MSDRSHGSGTSGDDKSAARDAGRTARQETRDDRRDQRETWRDQRDDRREMKKAERGVVRSNRREDREAKRTGRDDRREAKREAREDWRELGREERKESRQDTREDKREARREGRETRRDERAAKRDDALYDYYQDLDAGYAEHLDAAKEAGLDHFDGKLEKHVIGRIISGAMRRQAKRDVERHAGDEASTQQALTELELAEGMQGAGEDEAAYMAMQLQAMQNGWRERKLDRNYQDTLKDMALQQAALDAAEEGMSGFRDDPALHDRVEEGAANAYRRALKYTEGRLGTAVDAGNMAAGAATMANPVLAPFALAGQAGTALMDVLLGDEQTAATRAAEREGREHLNRKTKKAIRRDARFDRDGVFSRKAAQALPALIQSDALQREAFEVTAAEVTGSNLQDAFTGLAERWGSIASPGQDEDPGEGVTTDEGLESALELKATCTFPLPIPGFSDAKLKIGLGGELKQQSGGDLEVKLSTSAGLAVEKQIMGELLKVGIEASLDLALAAKGPDLPALMDQFSYLMMRAFEGRMDGVASENASELANEPVVRRNRRRGESDEEASRRIVRDGLIAGLWGMGGASGNSAYDEAQAWSDMIEERMIRDGASVGFEAGFSLKGGVDPGEAFADQSASAQPGAAGSGSAMDLSSAAASVAQPQEAAKILGLDASELKLKGDAGVTYAGSLEAKDGEIAYVDTMKQKLNLQGKLGPLEAKLTWTSTQGLGADDTRRKGELEYETALDSGGVSPAMLQDILMSPRAFLGPLATVFGLFRKEQGLENPPMNHADATSLDGTEPEDPTSEAIAQATGSAVGEWITDTGIDNNLEGVAGALARGGSMKVVFKGKKQLYVEEDGELLGRGFDNELVLVSELDKSQDFSSGDKGGMKTEFKASTELQKLILSKQQPLAPPPAA